MRRPAVRLWPRGLAGRLVLPLVAALAVAQVLLVLLLRSQQDGMIEGIVRGQALSQTVTLARLLDSSPVAEGPRLARAFRSREACAWVSAQPLAARTGPPMTGAEQALADLLARMLHGVRAGPPDVVIVPFEGRPGACADEADEAEGDAAWLGGGDRDARPRRPPEARGRVAGVGFRVPLADGRWLMMRTAVSLPPAWSGPTLLSFLLSALAVAAVTVLVVRAQTRVLRGLADASDRFGRGERVLPLQVGGPSEVAAAIRAFNTMQERLSQFLRHRLRLLAGISHDLRTPLTTLRLKAEFVEDEAVRDDIVATIDELAAICEATLAFTRAEAVHEATRRVDLRALCADLADEFTLAGADVEAAAGAPLAAACRPVALRRALRNLVENAVRYGGRARLSVGPAASGVEIQVDDDGPGLPADRIEDAFQPFVRLEASRSAETGGLGLGLAIARSIVRAHGGELTLANRAEGGLRAHVQLPA
ncbi:ATP-binding protein [Xanthobacter sp. V4C-4]|uniref:ATP-binding protein n=1 Tax=Xanthobacter cornucopiae TaxID=3119924 RepID=UPI003729CAD3